MFFHKHLRASWQQNQGSPQNIPGRSGEDALISLVLLLVPSSALVDLLNVDPMPTQLLFIQAVSSEPSPSPFCVLGFLFLPDPLEESSGLAKPGGLNQPRLPRSGRQDRHSAFNCKNLDAYHMKIFIHLIGWRQG